VNAETCPFLLPCGAAPCAMGRDCPAQTYYYFAYDGSVIPVTYRGCKE
jgi:hypothetical protein